MPKTHKMRAAVGYYATLLFLESGDLAIVAGRNLIDEWEEFQRTGRPISYAKPIAEDERAPRNLRLAAPSKLLTLNSLLYDLQPQEGNSGVITVLTEDENGQIGALTGGPILATDVERDDDFNITNVGDVWWFSNYQVEDELETLLNNGFVIIPQAPEAD